MNNNDDNKIITYYDTLKAAQVTIVRREINKIITDVVESISFCFKENPFPFYEIISIGDALFPPRLGVPHISFDADINNIGVFEYYDVRRMATISIVYNDDFSFKPVIALQILFEESNPISLSAIFSFEKKTFIGMPRGFNGVPIGEFEGGGPPKPQSKRGCNGCGSGKGSLSIDNIIKTIK
jgi:hypothetical protein